MRPYSQIIVLDADGKRRVWCGGHDHNQVAVHMSQAPEGATLERVTE